MKDSVLINYFKESFNELHKVTWPTRNQAVRITIIVLAFSLVVALFIGLLDLVFSFVFDFLVSQVPSKM